MDPDANVLSSPSMERRVLTGAAFVAAAAVALATGDIDLVDINLLEIVKDVAEGAAFL
jgi:hypothetical protein